MCFYLLRTASVFPLILETFVIHMTNLIYEMWAKWILVCFEDCICIPTE